MAFPSRTPRSFFTTPGGSKPATAARTTGKIDGPRSGLPTRLSCMWSPRFYAGNPSAASLRGKPMPTKESNIVKRTVALKTPPPLTAGQKARLDAVAAMPDAQIDDSDAPFLPDAVWTKAAVQLPHTKQQITLRIDAGGLDFLKQRGKRYQSRINAVLRSYVQAHKAHVK